MPRGVPVTDDVEEDLQAEREPAAAATVAQPAVQPADVAPRGEGRRELAAPAGSNPAAAEPPAPADAA
eukprot:1679714-Lingulodinium_polyedra.AAC.1